MDTDLELIRFEIYQTLIPSFNLLLPRKASTISSPTSSTHTDSSETGAYIYGYTHMPPSEAVNTLSCAYTSIRIKYAFASYKLIAPRAHAHTHTCVRIIRTRAFLPVIIRAPRSPNYRLSLSRGYSGGPLAVRGLYYRYRLPAVRRGFFSGLEECLWWRVFGARV